MELLSLASDVARKSTYFRSASTSVLGEDAVWPGKSPNSTGALLPSGIIGIHLPRFAGGSIGFPEPGFL
jgi:hypothetical protein